MPDRDDQYDAAVDKTGAFDFPPLLDESATPPPEEFTNPPGVPRGKCDEEMGAMADPDCELGITSEVEDEVLGETRPGYGIDGFDAEEDGGA